MDDGVRPLLFSQDNCELRFACVGRIVEGGAFAVALGGAKEQALLGMLRQADETGLAGGVGADLEIEFVEAAEAVGDVHADIGGVDGFAQNIIDSEIGGAGAEARVDGGDGFGIVGGMS